MRWLRELFFGGLTDTDIWLENLNREFPRYPVPDPFLSARDRRSRRPTADPVPRKTGKEKRQPIDISLEQIFDYAESLEAGGMSLSSGTRAMLELARTGRGDLEFRDTLFRSVVRDNLELERARLPRPELMA